MIRRVALAVCALCAVARADGGDPRAALARSAFTATPAELLAAAATAPDSLLLRRDLAVSYDERGLATRQRHRISLVRAKFAVELLHTFETTWDATLVGPPKIRVRVIAPSGAVQELDPATLTTESAGDDRKLTGGLPPLEVGAVIEEEVVTVEHHRRSSLGAFAREDMTFDAPGGEQVSFEAPVSLGLHVVARGDELRTRHELLGRRERWTYERSGAHAPGSTDMNLPDDVAIHPTIGVTSVADWATIARGLHGQLEQQLAAGPPTWPTSVPRGAPMATVRALLAWLNSTIHFDVRGARELPKPPAVVQRERRGDPTDRALLLVALLRQVGIAADVVLLGGELDPAVPAVPDGLGAVVRARVAGAERWLDPGEPDVRPGELGTGDYDRVALVLAADARGLSRTPAPTSAANVERVVRTFAVPVRGRARVTQTTRTTGVLETDHRVQQRLVHLQGGAAEAKARQDVARLAFGGDAETGTTSAADDLATPFSEILEARDARQVEANTEEISINLRVRDVLPPELLGTQEIARQFDFVWRAPYRHEIESRIEIPDGSAPPSPSSRKVALGPASYSEDVRVDRVAGQQVVVLTQRFDTGKRRISAAEYKAMRTAAVGLRDQVLSRKMLPVAQVLADDGKPREAVREARRMIAAHPRDAVPHERLCKILIELGLGEAARREAHEAVALAPDEAVPHARLAWALLHDRFGRFLKGDWDRAGVLAEAQLALAKDDHSEFAARLRAIALEHDPRGDDSTAELDAALEARRAAFKLVPSKVSASALALDLLRSEAFTAAEATARLAEPGLERDATIVAALAARDGLDAARRALQGLASKDPSAVLSRAGWLLMYRRRYDIGRSLLEASGKPMSASTVVVAVHPPVRRGSADPKLAAIEAMLALLDDTQPKAVFWDDRVADEILRVFQYAQVSSADQAQLYADDLQSSAQLEVTGHGGVWRVRVSFAGRDTVLFFALERGAARLIGVRSKRYTSPGVGRYLLAAARSMTVGRQLLDWSVDGVDPAPATAMLWRPGLAGTPAAIELAASTITTAPGARPAELARARSLAARCATNAPSPQLGCRIQAAEVARLEDRSADEAAALAQVDGQVQDRALMSWMYAKHIGALQVLGRDAEAMQVAAAWQAAVPDSREAAWHAAWAVMLRDPAEAVRLVDELLTRTGVDANDRNNAAWMRLWLGRDLPQALALAKQAFAADSSWNNENTLAAIEAELGDLASAIAHEKHSLATRVVRSADWYVQARIAEQLGLTADALAAYQHIQLDPVGYTRSYFPSIEMAKRRLAALQKP